MIYTIIATNAKGDSVELDLANPWAGGIAVTGASGLGPAEGTINTVNFATSDGALFNSSRIKSRDIELNLKFLGSDIEAVRHKLLRYFRVKHPITLDFITDYRHTYITGHVEKNEIDIFSNSEGADLTIVCPNPFFRLRDPVKGKNSVRFTTSTPSFEFEFQDPNSDSPTLIFGEMTSTGETVVVYEGDADASTIVDIQFLGPASGVKLYNTTTQTRINVDTNEISRLLGSTIRAGDRLSISSGVGDKYVKAYRDGKVYNALSALDKDSDWIFLTPGDNLITVRADTGIDNVSAIISFENLYESI
nr:MAG TPA: tail protein [Caudoviricetes sp.]